MDVLNDLKKKIFEVEILLKRNFSKEKSLLEEQEKTSKYNDKNILMSNKMKGDEFSDANVEYISKTIFDSNKLDICTNEFGDGSKDKNNLFTVTIMEYEIDGGITNIAFADTAVDYKMCDLNCNAVEYKMCALNGNAVEYKMCDLNGNAVDYKMSPLNDNAVEYKMCALNGNAVDYKMCDLNGNAVEYKMSPLNGNAVDYKMSPYGNAVEYKILFEDNAVNYKMSPYGNAVEYKMSPLNGNAVDYKIYGNAVEYKMSPLNGNAVEYKILFEDNAVEYKGTNENDNKSFCNEVLKDKRDNLSFVIGKKEKSNQRKAPYCHISVEHNVTNENDDSIYCNNISKYNMTDLCKNGNFVKEKVEYKKTNDNKMDHQSVSGSNTILVYNKNSNTSYTTEINNKSDLKINKAGNNFNTVTKYEEDSNKNSNLKNLYKDLKHILEKSRYDKELRKTIKKGIECDEYSLDSNGNTDYGFINQDKNNIFDDKTYIKIFRKLLRINDLSFAVVKKILETKKFQKYIFNLLETVHLTKIFEIHTNKFIKLLIRKIKHDDNYKKYVHLIKTLNKKFKFEIDLDTRKLKEYEHLFEEIIKHVNKGNYECDKRFLEKIKTTIEKVHVFDDPSICKMTVQFALCKNYIEDFLHIKKLMKKFTNCNL